MANYSNLKNIIDQVVRTNGQGDITGANLNQTLQQMVTNLGANYQYAGVATPSTNPGSPDQKVFYIATLAGTYSHFNNIVLPKGITVLRWNGSWSSTTLCTIDTGLSPNSKALVQSGTVFEKFKFDGGPWDVSAHFPTDGPNNNGKFTLEYILSNANTLIPASWRKGGMSIRFIQSIDNKYVQCRLMADEFTTDTTQWQGVDAEIVAGSRNLVESGGVIEKYGNVVKQTEQAVVGSSYNNYFHIYAKSGNVIYIKAIGTSGIIGGDTLPVYIGAIGGTSLGNVIVNGAVTRIVASEDIDTIDVARHLSGVSGSGSITVEVTVESDIISRVTEIANSQTDYCICSTVAANSVKSVSVPYYTLKNGGCLKIKFEHSTTSDNCTLNINGLGAKALYYKGIRAGILNTWMDNEVVEVYYDGEKFNAEPYHVIFPTIEPEFHTVSNTVASVTGSTYSNVININIKEGNLIKINANVADMLESGSNVGVGIKTNTEFYAFIYRDQDGLFFIAPYDITSMTLYLASTYVKQSNNITFTITDYGKSASNAVEYADIIGENSINPSTLGDGNISLFIGSKIKRGEPFAIRIEDKDGTIGNRAVSLRYQSSGSQALSTIETIPQKSELSEIHTLGEDITYLNVGVTKGTGTAPFGSGTFKVTVYKFAVDNVIIPFIKNNPADKKVAVNITNPYWSKCYQFTSPQSIYNTLEPSVKGIFVKFDNITIYDGRYRIIKQWSDVLSDIGKTGTVADDRTENVLLLNNGGAYNWALAFDLITNKFVIKEDTTALPTARYIYLAYSKEGNGCGEICYQYDSIKVANTRTLIKDVNQSYITRLRTKQMELLQAKDFFCFGFCTDVHFGMLNTGVFYPNVTNTIMNDTDNYIGLDAIINGGDDILNGTMVKQHGLDALKKEFESIDLSKFIPCVGNHDHNGVGDTMASVQKREWVITDKELEALYFRKCSNTYRPDGKLYYYRDFDEKKVRIIVLNTQDVPIEFNNNDELVYDPNIIFGIGQEQFNFIINALDISGKSDANDWKIIFVMHVPPYSASEGFVSNSELINRSIFRGILNAFVTKGTYSGSYIDSEYSGIFSVNVSVDYQTNPKPGKMIGVFCGHTHKDQYVDTDGFNCIGTQSSYPTDDLGKGGSPYMPVHTYDEFAIDVVILDDMQKKIVIKRLGHIPENQESGDREYSYDVS